MDSGVHVANAAWRHVQRSFDLPVVLLKSRRANVSYVDMKRNISIRNAFQSRSGQKHPISSGHFKQSVSGKVTRASTILAKHRSRSLECCVEVSNTVKQ